MGFFTHTHTIFLQHPSTQKSTKMQSKPEVLKAPFWQKAILIRRHMDVEKNQIVSSETSVWDSMGIGAF